jgi:hypothetical protein
MSYPSIGMRGLLEGDPEWDAALIEKMMRDGGSGVGIHIYFEEGEHLHYARFKDGKFQYVGYDDGRDVASDPVVRYENESFLEFAVWCAFYGRDFL